MFYIFSLYIYVCIHTQVFADDTANFASSHIYVLYSVSLTHICILISVSLYIYARARAHTHTQAFAGDTANFASAHLKATIYCVETKERVEMIQV